MDKERSANRRRDMDINELFGIDDITVDDLPDYNIDPEPKPKKEKVLSEYEQWLEDGLKENKGYGSRDSFKGTAESEGKDWYSGSTWEAYDKQQEETMDQLHKLAKKDAADKARDDLLMDTFAAPVQMFRHSGFSGDSDHFISMLLGALWYILTAMTGVGIGVAAGLEGTDLAIAAGIGGIIGAVIRYNGKENYTFTESLQQGAVEVSLFIASAIITFGSFVWDMPLWFMALMALLFATAGMFIREFAVNSRSFRESLYKCLRFIVPLIPPLAVVLFIRALM